MQYKKKIDKIFSTYIRQRDDGVCFTCGIKKPWKEMQAGHYIPRSHNMTRYDERNVNCQCMPCNVWKHGAMDVYALKLQMKFGDDILKELSTLKHQIKQFTTKELGEMLVFYREKLETL